MNYSFSHKSGFSLVEVIVATSIILIFLTSLIGAYNTYLSIALGGIREIKATFLLEESVEATKLLRDTSWTTSIVPLSLGTTYRLSWSGTGWVATTTYALIDSMYDRIIVFANVSRDAQSEIVQSGGTTDPSTRKVTTTVAWREGNATTTRTFDTYITNIFTN